LVDGLKGYSEFDIIDGLTLKNFLAENLVMNYSNIEIHKLLFQQMINGKQAAGQGQFGVNASQNAGGGMQGAPGQGSSSAFGQVPGQNNRARANVNSADTHAENAAGGVGARPHSSFHKANSGGNQGNNRGEHQQNISFNRNSQLAMANNFA